MAADDSLTTGSRWLRRMGLQLRLITVLDPLSNVDVVQTYVCAQLIDRDGEVRMFREGREERAVVNAVLSDAVTFLGGPTHVDA